MAQFTTILWDVDGTLLDFLYAQRVCIKNCFAKWNKPISDEMINRYSQINDSFWKQFELSKVTKEELLVGRFAKFFREYGITDIDPFEFRKEYEEGLGKVFKYVENSYEVCKSLHTRVKQYVVTNGVSKAQKNKLELSGLTGFFEELFISEDIGAPKPSAKFFDYCMEHIGEKDLSKILIVGDSLTSDIKGGADYGIKTCWYRPEGSLNDSGYTPDYEIEHLEQIFDIGEW